MKENELRIDNWINYENKYFQVQLRFFTELDAKVSCIDNFKPVPLTEKWLEKFGFVKESKYFCFVKISNQLSICFNYAKPPSGDFGQIGLEKWFEGLGQNVYIEFPNKIKYVHELQNIYFALTGEELKIK